MQQSMFSSAEPPASHSASLDCERDWLTRVATSCSPLVPLLAAIGLGEPIPEFRQHPEEGAKVPSSAR